MTSLGRTILLGAACLMAAATPALAQDVSSGAQGYTHHSAVKHRHVQNPNAAYAQVPAAPVPYTGCGVDWWVTADHYTRPITFCALF
jgi:hypothetical protein